MSYAEQLTRDYAAIRARLYGSKRVNIIARICPEIREIRNATTSWRQIMAEVCFARNVTADDIMGRSRDNRICMARHEIWWRIKQEIPGTTYYQMEKWFGRENTTIMHGVHKWEDSRNSIPKATRWRRLLHEIAAEHGVHSKNITGRDRRKVSYMARNHLWTRLYDEYGMNLADIGRLFDREDTNVAAGIRVWREISSDQPPL